MHYRVHRYSIYESRCTSNHAAEGAAFATALLGYPQAPALPQASEGSDIVTDYRAMGFTLDRHPLELLRDRLRTDRLLPASELAQLRNGQFALACGIVTVRHRPGTAKDVLFITLEDETGPTNVIIWSRCSRSTVGKRLARRYSRFMVSGKPRGRSTT